MAGRRRPAGPLPARVVVRACARRTRPRRCRRPCTSARPRTDTRPHPPSPSRRRPARPARAGTTGRCSCGGAAPRSGRRGAAPPAGGRSARRPGISSSVSSASSSAGRHGAGVELARAQRLGEGLLERPPQRHRLAHGLHVRRQARLGAGELLEREPRPLDHAVVDGRLEAGRRGARDVVGDLLQRVAHGQPRGDLGDREAGRLGGQRARARHARVHLDDHDLVGRRS